MHTKKVIEYGPPTYRIDPNWKTITQAEKEYYWFVPTPYGMLEISSESPDIAGPPPINANNMRLDCFEIARLFKENPMMQKHSPNVWSRFKPFADDNYEDFMQRSQLLFDKLFTN